MVETETEPADGGRMQKRRTQLEDGRYLIYYSFGDVEGWDVVGSDAPRTVSEAGRQAQEDGGV
jgi:hypothetical protein